MRIKSVFLFAGLSVLLGIPPVFAADPAPPAKADVRLVIDISGSMKENDPHNLRQPAVRMVTQLLPPDSRAGIWTFGQYVNMLVPHGSVDQDWRKLALQRSSKINSAGLYTNIGKALETASDDFYRDRRFENTHFIVLTDGMVDLRGNAAVDSRERARILDSVVARIKAKGAHIDTIALSTHADKALLKRMAVETGGTFTIAQSAEDLSRAFLGAFDNAAPAEQVPINNGGFLVDDSIKEFTALVFHKPGSQATQLVTPEGASYSAIDHPGSVHWLHEDAYDLVTIEKPQAGQWRIDAEMMPDNRVTVVSNLRLAVSDLPANFFAGDKLEMNVAFYDDKGKITDKQFLGLIRVDMTMSTEDGRSGTKTLSASDQMPADGVYHDEISRLQEPGTYQVKILADGRTFKREQTQSITLRPAVNVEVQGQGSGKQGHYQVSVTRLNPKLDLDQTTVELAVVGPDGQQTINPVALGQENGQWQIDVQPTQGPGMYRLTVRVKGTSVDGKDLTYTSGPFSVPFPLPADAGQIQEVAVQPPPTAAEPAPEPASKPKPEGQAPAPAAEPAPAPAKAEPVQPVQEPTPAEPANVSEPAGGPWYYWAGGLAALLLVLGGIVGAVIRRRGRQRRLESAEALAEAPPQPVPEPAPVEDDEEHAMAPLDEEEEQPVATSLAASETPALETPPSAVEEAEEHASQDAVADGLEETVPAGAPDDQPAPEGEESEPAGDTDQWSREDEAMAEIEDILREQVGTDAADVDIPVVSATESEAEGHDAAKDGAQDPPEDADADDLVEQIMAENAADDDYSLEDFDISDFDTDLQSEDDASAGAEQAAEDSVRINENRDSKEDDDRDRR